LGLDEESLTSREKPTVGEVVDKTIDRQTRPKQEQEQREVHKVSVKNLEAWFGTKQALKNINLDIKEKTVTAFIGPSGCGKTTLIRCLNRMHEMTPGARANGHVIIDGIDIYDRNIDPVIIKKTYWNGISKTKPISYHEYL
jgi:phosphate transport system ATP-binding protein